MKSKFIVLLCLSVGLVFADMCVSVLYLLRLDDTRRMQEQLTGAHETLMKRCDELVKSSDRLRHSATNAIQQAASIGYFFGVSGKSMGAMSEAVTEIYQFVQ